MVYLAKPKVYDIEDSNIHLLGSDLEKHVREAAGEEEPAWHNAGTSEGLQIWRIEKFHVVSWPQERHGTFYDGDSYIVLQTYKRSPKDESFSYNLHFWLGENTTQDEAGTAAYKSVELDDYLHGRPVQSREVQGYESNQFMSYFPQFICLSGGVDAGFRHISDPLPSNIHKLYRITFSRIFSSGRSHLVVREVPATAQSLVEGDVYILDKGDEILQFNSKDSTGQERFKAAEVARSFINARDGQGYVTVYDEGQSSYQFFSEFGENVSLRKADHLTLEDIPVSRPILFRLSDTTGKLTFESVGFTSKESLDANDVFLIDASKSLPHPTIYIWIGKYASLNERRLSLQYAQQYLYDKRHPDAVKNRSGVAIAIIKIQQGEEIPEFLLAVS